MYILNLFINCILLIVVVVEAKRKEAVEITLCRSTVEEYNGRCSAERHF